MWWLCKCSAASGDKTHERTSPSITRECKSCEESFENHTVGYSWQSPVSHFMLVYCMMVFLKLTLQDVYWKFAMVLQTHSLSTRQKTEFNQSIDTVVLTLFDDSKVFVIRKISRQYCFRLHHWYTRVHKAKLVTSTSNPEIQEVGRSTRSTFDYTQCWRG